MRYRKEKKTKTHFGHEWYSKETEAVTARSCLMFINVHNPLHVAKG